MADRFVVVYPCNPGVYKGPDAYLHYDWGSKGLSIVDRLDKASFFGTEGEAEHLLNSIPWVPRPDGHVDPAFLPGEVRGVEEITQYRVHPLPKLPLILRYRTTVEVHTERGGREFSVEASCTPGYRPNEARWRRAAHRMLDTLLDSIEKNHRERQEAEHGGSQRGGEGQGIHSGGPGAADSPQGA